MRLTEAAAERIRALQAASGKAVEGVRIGVKNGGCAGMEYTMEYAEARAPHDEVVEDKGVKLLIDPSAVLFLLGTEMDYRTDRMRSGFVFNNPNQTSACGCGESVSLKPADTAATTRSFQVNTSLPTNSSCRAVPARGALPRLRPSASAGAGPAIHVFERSRPTGRPHRRHDGRIVGLTGLSHPHRAHHEGQDVIAHAGLSLAPVRLRRALNLRPAAAGRCASCGAP